MKTKTKVVITFLLFPVYGYFCVLAAETLSWFWNILADLGAAIVVVLFFHFSFVKEEHERKKTCHDCGGVDGDSKVQIQMPTL